MKRYGPEILMAAAQYTGAIAVRGLDLKTGDDFLAMLFEVGAPLNKGIFNGRQGDRTRLEWYLRDRILEVGRDPQTIPIGTGFHTDSAFMHSDAVADFTVIRAVDVPTRDRNETAPPFSHGPTEIFDTATHFYPQLVELYGRDALAKLYGLHSWGQIMGPGDNEYFADFAHPLIMVREVPIDYNDPTRGTTNVHGVYVSPRVTTKFLEWDGHQGVETDFARAVYASVFELLPKVWHPNVMQRHHEPGDVTFMDQLTTHHQATPVALHLRRHIQLGYVKITNLFRTVPIRPHGFYHNP